MGLHIHLTKTQNNRRTNKAGLRLIQTLEVVFHDPFTTLSGSSFWSAFHPCPCADSTHLYLDPSLPLRLKDASIQSVLANIFQESSWDVVKLNADRIFILESTPAKMIPLSQIEIKEEGFMGMTYLMNDYGIGATFVMDLRRQDVLNQGQDRNETLCVLQSFPWPIRVDLYTLEIFADNEVNFER